MDQIGVTVDGMPVMAGVFRLMDTIGLPLDIISEELRERGMVIAWDEFILDAKAAGWKQKTLIRKLVEIDVDIPDILM